MADPSATIYIYAQFPKDLIPNTDPNLDPTNWVWAQCLAFPINKLNSLRFSSKPYKWIRYATGIVVGAHGDLCAQRDLSAVPVDYNPGLSATSMDLYYHTTAEEKRRMFPIDPRIANPRVVTSTGTSTRRDTFRHDVEMRDMSCVVTGAPAVLCDAAHILPHGKGDQYIKTFSTRRLRGPVGGDNNIVNSIDDVRNGLFVTKNIHGVLGQSVAFLKTPNFAMITTDVDPNAGTASEERFTNHLFDLSMQPHAGLSGRAIRVPSSDAERSEWPPPSLFEAIYASAVICHFGVIPSDLFKNWEVVFYEPDGASRAGQIDDKHRHDQADAEKRDREKQKTERQQCHRGRHRDSGFDALDVLMMVPFMVMPAEKARDYLEGCEKMATAKEREGLEVKVNSWREGVLSTSNNSWNSYSCTNSSEELHLTARFGY